jgi:hypothetical protein
MWAAGVFQRPAAPAKSEVRYFPDASMREYYARIRPADVRWILFVYPWDEVTVRDRGVIERTLAALREAEAPREFPSNGPRGISRLVMAISRGGARADRLESVPFDAGGPTTTYGPAFERELDEYGQRVADDRVPALRRLAPRVRRILVFNVMPSAPHYSPTGVREEGPPQPVFSSTDPRDVQSAMNGIIGIGGRGFVVRGRVRQLFVDLVLDDGSNRIFNFNLREGAPGAGDGPYPYPFGDIMSRSP